MTCRQVRHLLVACWGQVEQLEAGAAEHVRECEGCQREARSLRLTHEALRDVQAEPVPTGFAQRVMAQVGRAEPRGASWYQRALGWLSPPAPVFDWARATAVGLALAVACGGGIALYQGIAGSPGDVGHPVVAEAPRAADPAVASAADFETLLLQHETLSMTQTLSEDAGVHLVSYGH
jgi:negative regulator of sigma E activity